jgi:hypothetical protein
MNMCATWLTRLDYREATEKVTGTPGQVTAFAGGTAHSINLARAAKQCTNSFTILTTPGITHLPSHPGKYCILIVQRGITSSQLPGLCKLSPHGVRKRPWHCLDPRTTPPHTLEGMVVKSTDATLSQPRPALLWHSTRKDTSMLHRHCA